MHISSLPTAYGIGDFGPAAYGFIDFLADTGHSYWQVLPLTPTRVGTGNSPYSSPSAFAMNTLFISPQELVHRGYLSWEDLPAYGTGMADQVDFEKVILYKNQLSRVFFEKYPYPDSQHQGFEAFCRENVFWLEDYSLYTVLAETVGDDWTKWPEALRQKEDAALDEVRAEHAEKILRVKWLQFLAYEQWTGLKHYANERGIRIFGDLPLYVDGNSADCWARPEYFSFDEDLRPIIVSGVPPDYFAEEGQLWGSPVYHWKRMEEDGFRWWVSRIDQNLKLFDLLRIDHFRGLSAYWGIAAGEKTAKNGEWYNAPGTALLQTLQEYFPEMPFVAEDLGDIDQNVLDLRDRFDLPGMNVLQFAFGDKRHPNQYLPHRYVPQSITYTGTHDNNTTKGWFRKIDRETKDHLQAYLGWKPTRNDISEQMIRLALRSVSDLTIIPMQDILGLGAGATMNRPGVALGNWTWRMEEEAISPELRESLKELLTVFSREGGIES